jgi:two-component system, chemotaxis family, CheB/CheR fusion protein
MATEPLLFPIVGIGASAGGLEALRALLRFLPDDAGMAYVMVQHLDPQHESLLPDLLARATRMPVHEAREGMEVCADQVYVMAPNTDMTLSQGVLTLLPRTQARGQHLSIDTFLRSLAESRAALAIGVILSGTAADGTLGLQAIKAAGGMTFAQEPTSAQFTGTPQAIARELARISRHPYVRQPPVAETEEEAAPPVQAFVGREPEFGQILRVLGRRTDTDFSAYKPTTLKRRIGRRMALAPHGVLLLGPSETIRAASDLFVPVGEHKRQWYKKKAGSVHPLVAGDTRRSTRAPAADENEEETSMAQEERGTAGV